MTTKHIQTIGHFLATYKSDLNYISNFQTNKLHNFSDDKYVEKLEGTFYKFLIEFKVIRNVKKYKTAEVLNLTKQWIQSSDANDVDKFADELNRLGLTQDKKIMTSLASKILFLNNPYEIFPLDIRAKNSLKHKSNIYTAFLILVHDYVRKNENLINECLQSVQFLYPEIEAIYIHHLRDINLIRQNRFVDKLLWIGLIDKTMRQN